MVVSTPPSSPEQNRAAGGYSRRAAFLGGAPDPALLVRARGSQQSPPSRINRVRKTDESRFRLTRLLGSGNHRLAKPDEVSPCVQGQGSISPQRIPQQTADLNLVYFRETADKPLI